MLPKLLLVACGLLMTSNALPRRQTQSGIDWQPCPELNNNITILNGIQGAPFDCAQLSVPLDYTNPNSEPLQLALFRVNATKQPVLGSVLINFGGPGGTGAQNLPAYATEMTANIGEQWDLVSWDPRGTGKTIPFNCQIADSTTNTSKVKRDNDVLVSANLTEYFLNGGWDLAGAISTACYAAMNETGHYVGTSFVARDMMQIVDALGEDGLLRYYGWSYGTALGSYVAAMFPDRVARIVLDGNVNPHTYQNGSYGDFVMDADKAFSAFLGECLNNTDQCALAQYTKANNTQDMTDAINLLLQPLAANAATSDQGWETYSGVLQFAYQSLYLPATWPALAVTITEVLNGTFNGTASTTPNTTVEPYDLGAPWSTIGIRASDALWRTDSEEVYLPWVEEQDTFSSFDNGFPTLWISARWKIDAKERYMGDFNVTTAHPILYVNGEYDPVTPVANAYNASQNFVGSVVLPHSGYGHGLVADPSACMAAYIQDYFANGTLPPPGSHCAPDKGPWQLAAS